MYEQVGVREHGGHVNGRKQHDHHDDDGDDDYDGAFSSIATSTPVSVLHSCTWIRRHRRTRTVSRRRAS